MILIFLRLGSWGRGKETEDLGALFTDNLDPVFETVADFHKPECCLFIIASQIHFFFFSELRFAQTRQISLDCRF